MEVWTIQKLLNWTTQYFTDKGIDSPRLSAELLLSHVLGLKRIELYTDFDKPVAKADLDRLHVLVKRAAEHEPIAYLTGRCEFYSLAFTVTPDVMIPRPETELLVARAVEFLRARDGQQFVCDLCTGCGCVAIAIASNFDKARVIATDISEAALSIAAANVEAHGLTSRIELLCGDLFEPIVPQLDTDRFDLVVCNPPYISQVDYEKLEKTVRNHEPRSALYGGTDGLDILRKVISQAGQFMKDESVLMLEIGYDQGSDVQQLLEQAGRFDGISIEKDENMCDRLAVCRRKTVPPPR